ncbi:hypothetical protein ACIOZL_26795 [Streptomyces sp. NPDC087769]|uniref:hypothetical protein n=1 Tax=Streptomyces sp. NPDC087769 TaxID=3365802 RepID=UPI00381B8600
MEQEWLTGSAAAVGGAVIEGPGDLHRVPGTQCGWPGRGRSGLAVVGDCPATEEELRATPPAVRVGRWAELSRWSGSYWVIAGNGRQRFVCGDPAGIRALYCTPRDEGTTWASPGPPSGAPLVPDLPMLAARLAAGEYH